MLGINMLGHCVDCSVEVPIDAPHHIFKLKILDIIYSVSVPSHEAVTEDGAKSAWEHLLQQFFLRHSLGNNKLYSHGERELTEEEQAMLQGKRPDKKERRTLKLVDAKS